MEGISWVMPAFYTTHGSEGSGGEAPHTRVCVSSPRPASCTAPSVLSPTSPRSASQLMVLTTLFILRLGLPRTALSEVCETTECSRTGLSQAVARWLSEHLTMWLCDRGTWMDTCKQLQVAGAFCKGQRELRPEALPCVPHQGECRAAHRPH